MIYTLHIKDKMLVILGNCHLYRRWGMRILYSCDKTQYYNPDGTGTVMKDRYNFISDVRQADDLDSFVGKVYVLVHDDSRGDVLPFSTLSINTFFKYEQFSNSLRMIEIDFDDIPVGIRYEFLHALASIGVY
ncbi:hypothetical protein ACRYKS_22140 [Escherichia coli]|uniref:hypothetical protein n=1 Tax=Escherichia coli TaxID=562 RepID=UPI003D9477EA